MIRVRVPATSANLGPGFDCLGLALSLYNVFDVELAEGLEFVGCEPVHACPDNLFVQAVGLGFAELGLSLPGMRVVFDTAVPVARGLGSSATCIVGGLLAADALSGGALGRQRVLQLAAKLEGHPDNVAPALLGGFSVAVMDGGEVYAVTRPVGRALRFCALVPDFELETSVARAALPASLDFKDAVFNAGRAALMAAAFVSGDFRSLKVACEDRLHQPWRAPLIPGFVEIVAKCRAFGAEASFLSGAGPTIMAVVHEESAAEFAASMRGWLAGRDGVVWRLLELQSDDVGARVEMV